MVAEIIDKAFGYFQTGLGFIRNTLTSLASILPWEENLTMIFLYLGISFYLGYLITKRFVTNPISPSYAIPYSIISILIFIIINYLPQSL